MVSLAAITVAAAPSAAQQKKLPNVVMLMCDDAGCASLAAVWIPDIVRKAGDTRDFVARQRACCAEG